MTNETTEQNFDKDTIRNMVQKSIYEQVNENKQNLNENQSAQWFLSYALNNFNNPSTMSNEDLVRTFRAANDLGLFYEDTNLVSRSADLSDIIRSEEDGQRLAELLQGTVDEIARRPNMEYVFHAWTDYDAAEIESILNMINTRPSIWDKIMNFVEYIF